MEACKKELFFVVPEFGTRGQRGRNSEYICTGYESFEGSTHTTTSQKENLHIYNPCWKLSVLAQRGDRYGTATFFYRYVCFTPFPFFFINCRIYGVQIVHDSAKKEQKLCTHRFLLPWLIRHNRITSLCWIAPRQKKFSSVLCFFFDICDCKENMKGIGIDLYHMSKQCWRKLNSWFCFPFVESFGCSYIFI